MSKKNTPCGVLVYDRFFKDKPKAVLLLLKKTLWCFALAFCGIMLMLTEYALPLRTWLLAAAGALCATVFSAVFAFVKRRTIIPIVLIICTWSAFSFADKLRESLSYFADALMMTADGRFFAVKDFLLHDIDTLVQSNTEYVRAIELWFGLICVFFGFVCAAAFARKPKFMPSAVLLLIMCVPVFVAERFEFNVWVIPFAALSAGAWAVGLCFRAGLVPEQSGLHDYRSAAAYEEREFRRSLKRAEYSKRVRMSAVYYSKYFSVGMYCAALFALAGLISAAVFGEGSSLDYTALYNCFTEFGSDGGISSSPFENGVLSEYFADRQSNSDSRLNITSPGTGNEEIIRVTMSTDERVYLRGDIGIDFNGTSWTSPVNTQARDLSEAYRPCEARVIHSVLWADEKAADDIVNVSDITIDYLCSTSVVFLPAYTSEFTYYGNENFDVYGDFVVRVSKDYDNVNTVQCTALIPTYYVDESESDGAERLASVLDCFERLGISPNYIYSTIVSEMESGSVLEKYAQYVEKTYMSVPLNMSQELDDFLSKSGLHSEIEAQTSARGEMTELSEKVLAQYKTAQILCDYLKENYTYSLSADNSPNSPVLSFLNETKSGHCSLYASALTLLLRRCGIPARYCTGFVADPAQGSTVTLRAKNLHAWTEVYLEEYGWVTFDPTSSSLNPAQPVSPTQTSVSSAASSTSRTNSPLSTTAAAKPVEAPAKSDNNFAFALSVTAGVFVLIFAAALLIYIFYNQKKRAQRVLENLGRGEEGESSRQIYHIIIELFALFGLSPAKGELPNVFFVRCGEIFGVTLAQRIELLERAAFDSADFTEEERAALHQILREFYSAAEEKSSPVKKIKLHRLLLKK